MGNREKFLERLENQYDKKINDNFFKGFELGLINDLDKTWLSGDIDKYTKMVENIKSQGIRVFRNEQGKHKITYI